MKKLQQVKRYIIPLLWHASDSMKDITATLAHIASVRYAHKTKNKRENDVAEESNTWMSPDLQLVFDYLSQEEEEER